MPKPYSADLRERVLLACERNECSQAEIARRFAVAEVTVSTRLRAWRENAGGGRPSRQAEACHPF